MSLTANRDGGAVPFDFNDPRARDMIERHRALAARGALAVVLSDSPLPAGQSAIVVLNQAGSLERYLVTTDAQLDESLLRRANGLALQYQLRNPDDSGPTTLRLYDDARFESESPHAPRQYGTFSSQPLGAHVSDATTQEIRRLATQVQPQDVPGVGRARVVRLNQGNDR